MENLFGRFPHLVEDVFGLLEEETLFHCSQINKAWNKNLDNYRLHLVKRIQSRLKDPIIVYGPAANFDRYEGQNLPKTVLEDMPTFECHGPTRIYGSPKILRRMMTIEHLPLLFLVQFLRYFCDHSIRDCEISDLRINRRSLVLGVFVQSESNCKEVNEYIGWIANVGLRRTCSYYCTSTRAMCVRKGFENVRAMCVRASINLYANRDNVRKKYINNVNRMSRKVLKEWALQRKR